MAVYELRIENNKKSEGCSEIFYLVPSIDRLDLYKEKNGELEKLSGAVERGWNLFAGGTINL